MVSSLIIFISVFFGGLLSFFSPCIFPIIPLYFGILSEGGTKYKKILNTFLFVLGLGLTFVALGFSFSIIGDIFFNEKIKIIAGIIIILFGISQLELFKIKALQKTKMVNVNVNKYKNSGLKSFMLGLTFSLGWTPCVGPILATVLAYAGDSQSSLLGIFLMIIYVLGLTIPFIIFSFLSDELLSKTRGINKYLPLLKKISGILIILMGILLMFDKLNIFL